MYFIPERIERLLYGWVKLRNYDVLTSIIAQLLTSRPFDHLAIQTSFYHHLGEPLGPTLLTLLDVGVSLTLQTSIHLFGLLQILKGEYDWSNAHHGLLATANGLSCKKLC